MVSRRYSLRPVEGKEIPVSVLRIEQRKEMLWISLEPIPLEEFPPCIKNMISRSGERGKHRASAILAAFLGQAGWREPEAEALWSKSLENLDVSERLFQTWFRKMHCPSCITLKRESRGYPDLGVAGLGYCEPDERCEKFEGPLEYASDLNIESERERGRLKHIKTTYLACVFNWVSGRYNDIELSERERKELEALLAQQAIKNDKLIYTGTKVRGRLKPKFLLKEADELRRQLLSELL